MIDWTKEVGVKNYCGYCDGTPSGYSICRGSCFTRKDYSPEEIRKNRVDHILESLKIIPIKIKELEQREKDLIDELENPSKI